MAVSRASFVLTGLLVALAPVPASAEQGDRHHPRVPPVPADIEAPAGHSVYLKGYAAGTQNFICAVTKTGTLDWAFIGPQATLFLTANDRPVRQTMTHFLSQNPDEVETTLRPTWQDSGDSSAVWAIARQSSQDPAFVDPDAIPWLLLEVVGDRRGPTGGAGLTRTTFIQRLTTSGGKKPTTGCAVTNDIGAAKFVVYTAEYFFYRAD